LVPIGRLETEAAGLVVLTSDTAVAQRLSNRRHMPARTYRVDVEGAVGENALRRLRAGAWVDGTRIIPQRVELVHRQRDSGKLEIALAGGGHRELSRLLRKTGHRARRVLCVAMGRLSLRGTAPGSARLLSPQEVDSLQKLAEAVGRSPNPLRSRPRAKPANRSSSLPALRRLDLTGRPPPMPPEPVDAQVRQGAIVAPTDEIQGIIAPSATRRRMILPDSAAGRGALRPGRRRK